MDRVIVYRLVNMPGVEMNHYFAKQTMLDRPPCLAERITVDGNAVAARVIEVEHINALWRFRHSRSAMNDAVVMVQLADDIRGLHLNRTADELCAQYANNGWSRVEYIDDLRLGDFRHGDVRKWVPESSDSNQQECAVGSTSGG